MHSLYELPTPYALVDLDRLERNTQAMSARAHQLGVHLRPHVKTHKTTQGARYQTVGHFGGIAVSTLAEASLYGASGFTDITYAVPITPSKIPRAIELSRTLDQFYVLVDRSEVVTALSQQCADDRERLSVLIKVDCGYGRAGLSPDDPTLPSLARAISDDLWLDFAGVLTHGGQSYDCANVEEIKAVARRERAAVLEARDQIEMLGISVPMVSLGSTPTATVFDDLSGVTELRPGNYALFDLFQASIGSCNIQDIALSVVTEVIAYYPERLDLLIDAGALALSKDRGPDHLGGEVTYGKVCSMDYREIPELSLIGLSQEHGKISATAQFDFAQIEVGTRLRILPNHSCLVTALHEQIYVERGMRLIDKWAPVRGW